MNVELKLAHDDGQPIGEDEVILTGYVYLHVLVFADGAEEGELSGWFKPEHASAIKEKLSVGPERLPRRLKF